MIKKLIVLLVLLLAIVSCSGLSEHRIPLKHFEDIEDQLLRSFVYIDSTRGIGNGFAVDDYLVLTNHHVCRNGIPEGENIFGIPIEFELVDISIEDDLCLLRSNIEFPVHINQIVINPLTRTPVHNICTPHGIYSSWPDIVISVNQGYYLGVYPEQDLPSMRPPIDWPTYFDLDIAVGCSGSAIVDSEYRLLGIVTMQVSHWNRGTVSSSGEAISEFLWRNGVSIEIEDQNERIIINDVQ